MTMNSRVMPNQSRAGEQSAPSIMMNTPSLLMNVQPGNGRFAGSDRASAGLLSRWAGNSSDIGSRQASDWQQQASRYQQLLQILPAAVLILDNRGHIAQANPASQELFGELMNAERLEGLRWRTLIQRCFSPRKDDGHEVSLINGRRVQIRTNALVGESGQLVLVSDLTETRALQTKLAQHERLSAMGKMVASLAHQVRTPLAAATLYAGHLASPDLDTVSRQRFSGKLIERLHHLEAQVRDMLIFARGDLPLNDELRLSDLIDDLTSAMEIPLAQYQAQCAIDNRAGTTRIRCNKDALVSALMNLVNNALEACRDLPANRRQIMLKLVAEQDADPGQQRVRVVLSDNGPGLSAEQQQAMLEPFATTKSNGTGLGLAVVQAVARAHGGELQLGDSESGGLQAAVYLPVFHALAEASNEVSTPTKRTQANRANKAPLNPNQADTVSAQPQEINA
ncbi:MAG: sensor histidine kinase [Oceanobacter sp.]